MAQERPQYYRPYLPSDSELSDADTLSSPGSSPPQSPRPDNAGPDIGTVPDFSQFAKALQQPINEASGPSFSTIRQVDSYGTNYLTESVRYAPYGMSDISGIKLESAVKDVATVAMLQSRDRDKTIWPQPTDCQLFLPREYKNVVGFSIAQLNLISAFFYFRQDKENLGIEIIEKDRILYDSNSQPVLDLSGNRTTLKLYNYMRPGSYNITGLLSELQTQLNRTPLFYDFINGFSDFLPLFSVNGDYSLNFNYPGDNYYDSVRKIFISNPTRSQIVGYYFQSQFANQFSFTIEQVRVAYYYPVLKELVLDPNTNLADYNFTYQSMTQAEVIQHIIYTFTGLDDPIVITVINNNISKLDLYRLQHTFRYSLVNKYNCSYDTANNRVTIQSGQLNTSLASLLNTQYNAYLSQLLSKYNLSAAQYNTLATDLNNTLSILQSMYDYMQVLFAQYFAVNYGTFSRSYYANSSNTLLLRSGLDASGISIRYDPNVAPTPRDNDLLDDFRKNPPYYWNKMSNLNATQGGAEGAQRNMGRFVDPYPTSSNFAYNLSSSNINTSQTFIDLSGNIYTDYRRRAGDILTNIDSTKYTIFQFRSKYRQTLQVESLPRQTNWRYPLWNKNNVVEYPLSNLFDVSYSYVAPITSNYSKVSLDVSFNTIRGWTNTSNTTTNFGASFTTSSNLWSSNYEELNIVNSNGKFYYFQTPSPSNAVDRGSNVYTYPFNVTIVDVSANKFPSELVAFFYHDLAAFTADVSGQRKESPLHYKHKMILGTDMASNTYSFTAYANQQYYVLLRPSVITPFSTRLCIVPWFPNGTSFSTLSYSTAFNPLQDPATMLSNFNVAKAADPAYLRLPIQSTLWAPTPEDAEINKLLRVDPPKIGYDSNLVSNDMTDYIPFAPFSNISSILPTQKVRIDPTNNYVFQYNSPYDLTAQSYFYSTSRNALLTSNADFPYTWKGTTSRSYKIMHNYGTHYMPDTAEVTYTSSDITPYISPYTSNTTGGPIFGYNYKGTNQTITLGAGLSGWMFLPGDGTWAIDRITYKDNFVNPEVEGCKNRHVHALAVFFTSEITTSATSFISLSNALAILLLQKKTTYTSSNLNLGVDAAYGTYYTYSNYPSLVSRSNFTISGFTQSGKMFIGDANTYYSVIPFTFPSYSNWNISNVNISTLKTQLSTATVDVIQNLCGSPVAYPLANTPYTQLKFYDNTAAPTGQGMVLSTSNANPVYGPQGSADESVSVYEQSIPIVNSHIHYLQGIQATTDSNAFNAWSNMPMRPTFLVASIPKTMLFQNGNFAVCSYITYNTVGPTTPPARSFANTLVNQLTVQQIFPDGENTSLLAVSGNASNYCFVGASNNKLRFKVYEPYSGVMTELPQNPNYTFSNTSLQVQKFVFHNSKRWFMTSLRSDTDEIVLQGCVSYSDASANMIQYAYANKRWSELAMDPSGLFLYFVPMQTQSTGFSTMNLFSFNPTDTRGYIGGTSTGYTVNIQNTGGRPPKYSQLAVTINKDVEEVLLTSISYFPSRFYKIRNYQPTGNLSLSNTIVDESVQNLRDANSNGIVPSRLFGGANGSKWFLFDSDPVLMGNRNDAFDAPVSLNIAWQIFFPQVKLEMRKLTNGNTPIVDLTNVKYPEFPHVCMFAYSNYQKLILDISANNGQWGLENSNNFMVSDISFNGYYFNSYMMDIPLYPNYSNATGNYSNDYYLAVRGYLPTEAFQTMLRFYLPNRYDFGFLRLMDISAEVLFAQSNASEFNPVYYNTLIGFNSNYAFSNRNFGSNINTGYAGSNLSSSNFGHFLAQYKGYYNTYLSNSATLSNIQIELKNNMNTFIQKDLKYILPESALTRQRFIDPLLFQIMWKDILTPNFVTLDDEWGLGWNLGYDKRDTGFATIHTGSSFFKIQQDFIYLRLNPEFNINKMDAGGKEDYKTSRLPTGTTNQYYCKLLLTNFGGNATTFVHNPITFNPPLFRLNKLAFQWIDAKGNVIDNNDAEWNMTINVTERTELVSIPGKMAFAPADPKRGEPGPPIY